MTRNLETLRAVEVAAAARLKMLLDVRHNAQSAMEAAHSEVTCAALEWADLERLDRDFVNTLAKAIDDQFETLIDEAESNLWTAKNAIEELEEELDEAAAELRMAEAMGRASMTEDEALTKWCPFARVLTHGVSANRDVCLPATESVNGAALCIGSACMAWRTRDVYQGEALFVSHGHCGLAGEP